MKIEGGFGCNFQARRPSEGAFCIRLRGQRPV